MRYSMSTAGEARRNHRQTMARTQFPAITTTSEWLKITDCQGDYLNLTAAGKAAMKLVDSFRVISAEDLARETDRALGFNGHRWNSCANRKPATVWLPKSQVRELVNDYWVNGAARMFLVPTWLINAKEADGYELN
jgi:hypothetical protein